MSPVALLHGVPEGGASASRAGGARVEWMTRGHLYLRAEPGKRDELLRTLDQLAVLDAKRRQPGFLAAEIQLPLEDDERLLVWSSWASREHYERWLAGPAGQGMLREIRTLLAEEPVWRVYQVVDTIH